MWTSTLFDSLSEILTVTLFHFLWEGAVIGGLAAGGATLLRQRSPQARYGVYLTGLGLMAGCLAATWTLVATGASAPPAHSPAAITRTEVGTPSLHSGREPATASREPVQVEGDSTPGRVLPAAGPPAAGPPREEQAAVSISEAPPHWLPTCSPYIAAAYLLGLVLMLLRVVLSLYGGHRLRRDAVAMPDSELPLIRRAAAHVGLGQAPLVAICRQVPGPVVLGVFRPVVLLPATLASGLTPWQLETILAHEFAHLQHHDHWVLMLQRLIESVLFFHPAVWYLSARLSEERENCCDEAVVAAGTPKLAYAELLLAVAGQQLRSASASTSLAMAGGKPSRLRRRIARLFQPPGEPALRLGSVSAAGLLFLVAALVILPLLSYGLAALPPRQPEQTPSGESTGPDQAEQPVPAGHPQKTEPMKTAAGVPQHLAQITRPEGEEIVWGEPVQGLAVGIGKISTSLKSPVRPMIQVYLENRTQQPVEGVMQTRASFILELDGKFYVEVNFGGPVGELAAGTRIGPIPLNTDYFNQTKSLETADLADQTTPGPDLIEGEHTLRLHYQLSGGNNPPGLIASSAVRFKVALVPYPVDEAVALLVRELQDRNQDVRRDAALYAGKLRLPGTRAALEQALKDQDAVIRRYAASALGNLGDRAAVEPLHGLLTDEAMDVRLAAAESLVQLGEPLDPAWVEPIIKSKHMVFQNAIWLVRRHAGKQAVPALIRCLDDDPAVNNYYNYTLVHQIHACGGPALTYHHDFDNQGTPEQVNANRLTLAKLRKLLDQLEDKTPESAAGAEKQDGPALQLAGYLKSAEANGNLQAPAEALVKQAQLIRLYYEYPTPVRAVADQAAFVRTLKASEALLITQWKGTKPPTGNQPVTPPTPQNSDLYLEIQLTFSRLFGDANEMPPAGWLEQMRRPLGAGYRLKTVSVILSPSQNTKQASFAAAGTVMNSATDRLKALQGDFIQLKQFSATHHLPGEWTETGWPRFPALIYQHAVGPLQKGGRPKLADDWCVFSLVIAPLSGNPRQRPVSLREYPRQGIVAEWTIETDNEALKKKFEEVVTASLKELDALEAGLKGE